MKIRKRYVIRVSSLQRVVWIGTPRYGRKISDYFSQVFDCNFEQAKFHLEKCSNLGYYISKRRK